MHAVLYGLHYFNIFLKLSIFYGLLYHVIYLTNIIITILFFSIRFTREQRTKSHYGLIQAKSSAIQVLSIRAALTITLVSKNKNKQK